MATIPPFSGNVFRQFVGAIPKGPIPAAEAMTPGGFHSFEHRWALADAFRFHAGIGKRRIQERIRALNDQIKDGLAKMPNVRLHTPRSAELSSGIVAFEVDGKKSGQVVQQLWKEHQIGASVAPYASRFARYSGSLLTNPEEIDRALAALRDVA
jgi:selenocysteine lyase/cysteine desulfurase